VQLAPFTESTQRYKIIMLYTFNVVSVHYIIEPRVKRDNSFLMEVVVLHSDQRENSCFPAAR